MSHEPKRIGNLYLPLPAQIHSKKKSLSELYIKNVDEFMIDVFIKLYNVKNLDFILGEISQNEIN